MEYEKRIEELEDEVLSLKFLVKLLIESDTRKSELLSSTAKVIEKHTEILGLITERLRYERRKALWLRFGRYYMCWLISMVMLRFFLRHLPSTPQRKI